ncbi:MAG: TIGR02452 family protein [Lachnospiraceae bacterium]|nr:TIGR02452 family protein [Lachnospiraceae bacterium]
MGWNDRNERIAVFEDTMNMCNQNKFLRDSILRSIAAQRLYYEDDDIAGVLGERGNDSDSSFMNHKEPMPVYDSDADIIVSKKRSFEAAGVYAKSQKVCVLNFASATNPGGGVKKGSSAQEECLCRCSSLYPCISADTVRRGFHERHRKMLSTGKLSMLYNDDCIYTPGVPVFKKDSPVPRILPEKEWFMVDVITCAAPNLRSKPSNYLDPASGTEAVKIRNSDLKVLHEKRASRIFDVAKANGVEIMILGAFGCGAFQNPPEIVAAGICGAVKQLHRRDFRTIEFAVFCPPGHTENYDAFRKVFGEDIR